MNVLLTGTPGVGKTTVIRQVLSCVRAKVGGFTTQEIRRSGRRVGFSIRAVDTGQEGLLAHVDFRSPHRVGPYGVHIKDMEAVGVVALRRALESADLIIMDEIGRMENYCPSFQKVVLQVLDAPQDVLGTLQMRSTPFLDGIRRRPDVIVKLVTIENRGDVPAEILSLLGNRRDSVTAGV